MERPVIVIPLTRGKQAIIDAESWDQVKGYKWSATAIGRNYYAVTDVKGLRVYMHRLLLPDVELVDHKDGDGLNNRQSNLRHVSKQVNSLNSRKRTNNSSGYIGVSYRKDKKKFEAKLTVNGSTYHLGKYSSPFLAALAYDRALIEWAGEYGVYNFGN